MRKTKLAAVIGAVFAASVCCTITAQAAVAQNATAAAYDKAVDLVDSMDGLNATIKESIGFPNEPDEDRTLSTVKVQATGLKNSGKLQALIDVKAVDGEKMQAYTDGTFYTNQTGKNLKYAMSEDIMKEMLNFYIYLDFNSNYLSELSSQKKSDGTITYKFAATEDSIGDYADKILAGTSESDKIKIESIDGTMTTDKNGMVTKRKITTTYETGTIQPILLQATTDVTFKKAGTNFSVKLPDLSSYSKKKKASKHTPKANPDTTSITPLSQTVYATANVNIRAQNNVSSTILGGAGIGESLLETGYTSDGWTQISYNGSTAYVKSDYISTTKPVIETPTTGMMYAACSVNVRESASSSSTILGVLSFGEGVQSQAYTDTNWIKVIYDGRTGYVYADYMLGVAPIDTSNSSGNTMNDEYDSDGNLIYDGSDRNGNTMNDEYDSNGNTMDDEYQESFGYGTCIALGMSTITIAMDDGRVLSAMKDEIDLNYDSIYEGAACQVWYIGDQITAIGW